jgi:hypothetical protein
MLNDVEHVIGCIKATPFILPGRGGMLSPLFFLSLW